MLRLIVADRLVPSAKLPLGTFFLVVAAEPVLALARDRRGPIWAIALLGLSPLLVDRLGQLAMTYLVPFAAHTTPGYAMTAPRRLSRGPLVLWQRSEPAPAWLKLLDDRANLISAWCIGLWGVGLRQLDGGRLALWHVALPVGCVVAAGLVTWVVGPLVLAAILSGG